MTFTSKMLDRCEAHSRMEIVVLAIVAFLSPHKAHKAFLRFLNNFCFLPDIHFPHGKASSPFPFKIRPTLDFFEFQRVPKSY